MKRLLKRLLSIISILILLVILVVFVWWFLPYSRIDMGKISDTSTILQADIPSSSGSLTRTIMENFAQQGVRHLSITGAKGFALKIGIPIIFPQEIKSILLPKPSMEQPTFLLGIDWGRAIRIVHPIQDKLESQLFQGSPTEVTTIGNYRFVKRIKPLPLSVKTLNACAWIDSGLVISNDPEFLKEFLAGYPSITSGNKASENTITLSIDNHSSFLTQKIRTYEKKYEYDIFSSIDQVGSVDVQGVPKDPDTISGTIVFHGTTDLTDDSPMVSDVNFFYGVLRRGLRPQGIEVKGTESHKGNDATLTMELTGISTAMSQIENLTGEGL